MYFWYGIVCFSSILENFAGVPLTRTTTIRVWRASKVTIDPDSPWVVRASSNEDDLGAAIATSGTTSPTPLRSSIPRKPVFNEHSAFLNPSEPVSPDMRSRNSYYDYSEILTALEHGYNTVGNVYMSPSAPRSAANDAFYVLISIQGVSHAHAVLRVFSKMVSIGVFAVSTSLFASATLITIIIAVVTAVLILGASVFGRVTAMYMASEMMRYKPVLHKVVRNRTEAGKYLDALFRQPDLACEVLGHVIVQGRCIKKFRRKIRLSHILGVLARPLDLRKMSTRGPNTAQGTIRRHQGGFEDGSRPEIARLVSGLGQHGSESDV